MSLKVYRTKPALMMALCLVYMAMGYAQPHPGKSPMDGIPDQSDRIQSLRIAYFVEHLNLTSQESAEFWPIWNEEQAKIKRNQDAIDGANIKLDEASTDIETAEILEELKQLRITSITLAHASIERLSGIIGLQRAAKMPRLERDFRSQVMKSRMQQRMNGPQHPNGPQRPGRPGGQLPH